MKPVLGGVIGVALLLPLIVVVLFMAPEAEACGPLTVDQVQAAPVATVELAGLSGRQVAVARAIYDEGLRRSLEPEALVLALAVASQESTFQVYANDGKGGDLKEDQVDVGKSMKLPHDAVGSEHGSVGPFQQQWPWWGPMRDLMDPTRSAGIFYDALLKVPGWENMPLTVAAQRVQRSAYPSAYADDEDLARQLVAKFAAGAASNVSPASSTSTADLSAECAQLAAAMTCPPTDSPAEAGLSPDGLLVLRCVDQQFGPHTYGGIGERASNPTSDHPSGRAVDVMIADWQSGKGRAEGQAIADWVRAHATELGVKYVIWRGRIWNVGDSGWAPYSHPSGATDPTSMHMDHVHVSVYGSKGTGFAPTTGVTWPIPAKMKGSDRHNYGGTSGLWLRKHTGTDFSVPCGTPVYASHAGTVTIDTDEGWSGRWLVKVSVGPAGLTTWYAHMQAVTVQSGQSVTAGQQIGAVGSEGNSTGCHLHFEVHPRNGGIYEDGIDPSEWLKKNVGRGTGAPGNLGVGWRIASYNALGHNHTAPGGDRPWLADSPIRTLRAMALFTKHDLSVIGLQEFQPPQSRLFLARGGHQWGLYPRPGGREPDNAIAWRKDRFRLVTTRRVTIPYFGGKPRSMPAVLLANRATSRRYWVISVHNPANAHGPAQHWRNESIRRERAFVAQLRATGYPVFLTGDLNDRAPAFCGLTRGGLMTAAAGGTNTGRCNPPPRAPIDWIFAAGIGFTGYMVDESTKKRSSDHPLYVASVAG